MILRIPAEFNQFNSILNRLRPKFKYLLPHNENLYHNKIAKNLFKIPTNDSMSEINFHTEIRFAQYRTSDPGVTNAGGL